MNEPKTDEAILIELNERIGQAEKARDDQFMWHILSDKLSFRRADGEVVCKPQYLMGLINPEKTYERLETSEIMLVHCIENIAVVSMIVDAAFVREGKPSSGKYRNIRIFKKEPDAAYGWKCYMWFNEKITG